MRYRKYLGLLGRLIYGGILLNFARGHFSAGTIHWAASVGVPMAGVLVPLSGAMLAVGSLSVILGFKPRWGALLIVLFLLPVSFKIHAFWNDKKPEDVMFDQMNFYKNMIIMGAALTIMETGTGGLSLKD